MPRTGLETVPSGRTPAEEICGRAKFFRENPCRPWLHNSYAERCNPAYYVATRSTGRCPRRENSLPRERRTMAVRIPAQLIRGMPEPLKQLSYVIIYILRVCPALQDPTVEGYREFSPAGKGSELSFPTDLIRQDVESLRNLVRVAREFGEPEANTDEYHGRGIGVGDCHRLFCLDCNSAIGISI